MTIAQLQEFYQSDVKKYEIENNRDFLNWLRNTVGDGYHCFIKIDELQNLIDSIVNWYEIKYPERELEGTKYINFQDIHSISVVMNIRQLFYRLPYNQLHLMECGYRAKGWSHHPIYENGEQIGCKSQIFIHINKREVKSIHRKKSYFLIHADYLSGEVLMNYDLQEYYHGEENVNLDELLSVFNVKYVNKLDFSELKKCVYNHSCDVELRHRILQFVALKLLYSRNTIPERGYERAKRFISEFNDELGLLLSTDEIDKIVYEKHVLTKTVVNKNNVKRKRKW